MVETVVSAARGRPKGDKRARTRAKLIDACAAVVREKGFDRTTLEDVARRAGVTRGSIRGNFKDKDDLFLAVAITRWEPIAPPLPRGGSLKELMRILADAVVEALPSRRAAAVGAASFQVYALSHEEARERVAQAIGELYRWSEAGFLDCIPQSDLPMPAHTFIRVLHALTEGLLYQRFMAPEFVTDEVIYAALDALAGGPWTRGDHQPLVDAQP
ncbi:MAG TPA: TetR/AcrR family transcriptional regulator [Caulobacteraceae bacterium]|jgi:AcrR family transcriptional regulator